MKLDVQNIDFFFFLLFFFSSQNKIIIVQLIWIICKSVNMHVYIWEDTFEHVQKFRVYF